MRHALLFAAACLACATAQPMRESRDPILAPLAVSPSVHVESEEVIYEVHATSPQKAREEMNRRRPVGDRGPFDALTKWFVSWHFSHRKEGGRCRVGTPRIEVAITTTLPRWIEGESTEGWQRYLAGLSEHESGHAQNARAAGEAVFETLEKLPPAASCGDLDAQATREGKEVLRSFNAEDDAYDQRTQHGKTQGATFP